MLLLDPEMLLSVFSGEPTFVSMMMPEGNSAKSGV
jgi:hypothetical protein